jgi:hypothetical protein
MDEAAHARFRARRGQRRDGVCMHCPQRLCAGALQQPGTVHDRVDILEPGQPVRGSAQGGDIAVHPVMPGVGIARRAIAPGERPDEMARFRKSCEQGSADEPASAQQQNARRRPRLRANERRPSGGGLRSMVCRRRARCDVRRGHWVGRGYAGGGFLDHEELPDRRWVPNGGAVMRANPAASTAPVEGGSCRNPRRQDAPRERGEKHRVSQRV